MSDRAITTSNRFPVIALSCLQVFIGFERNSKLKWQFLQIILIVCAPTVLSLPLNTRNMATPSFLREEVLDILQDKESNNGMSSGEEEYLDRELEESGDDLRYI